MIMKHLQVYLMYILQFKYFDNNDCLLHMADSPTDLEKQKRGLLMYNILDGWKIFIVWIL